MPSLLIKPLKPDFSSHSLRLPTSKSVTNRVLLLSLFAQGMSDVIGFTPSEDTEVALSAVKKLEAPFVWNEKGGTLTFSGTSRLKNSAFFDMRNSGTTARFLPALLATQQEGEYVFKGSPMLSKRPMKPLLDVLIKQGAVVDFLSNVGCYPFVLKPQGLKGGCIELDASLSGQFLSALLMAAPLAKQDTEIYIKGELVSRPFVDMTCAVMKQFGVVVACEANRYSIPANQHYQWSSTQYMIEPDLTAASYFGGLSAITNRSFEIEGAGSRAQLQGDRAFIHLLESRGIIRVQTSRERLSIQPGNMGEGFEFNFSEISDTFMTLAAMSPVLKGKTMIQGIAHTRKQESDRVQAISEALTALGQHVEEGEGALTVKSDLATMAVLSRDKPIEIKTYNDHRIAMSFGMLGCYDLHGDGRPWLSIDNPACCAKTFPSFFDILESLR